MTHEFKIHTGAALDDHVRDLCKRELLVKAEGALKLAKMQAELMDLRAKKKALLAKKVAMRQAK